MSEKSRLYRVVAVVLVMLAALGAVYFVNLIYSKAQAATQPVSHHTMDMGMNDNMQQANVTAPATLTPLPNTPTPAAKTGCEIKDLKIGTDGGDDFKEPDVVTAVNGQLTLTLVVGYADNNIGKSKKSGGCEVHLRSYNGKLVGPTIRARPGDTLNITLVNNLPQDDTPHVMNQIGGALNDTNLHTHGLHVSPVGNSDNVLLDIVPGQTFQYEIKIPLNQVPGTYWYHSHEHGTTALQVSSGMEGAIIIMGDEIKSAGGTATPAPNNVDQLPEVKKATEKIFVLQQIIYDEAGVIEPDAAGGGNFPSNPSLTYFGPCNWEPMKRENTINGQLFPVLKLSTGEMQRWRFIDSGIRETVGAQLIGPYADGEVPDLTKLDKDKFVDLNEIAVDGIFLDHVDSWKEIELEPGYRSDVLVKVNKPGTYYLIDNTVPQMVVTRDQTKPNDPGAYITDKTGSFSLTCGTTPESPNFLASVIVTGKDVDSSVAEEMKTLSTQIAKLPVPDILKPIVAINTDPSITSATNEALYVPLETIDSFQKVDFTLAGHPAVTATPVGSATPFSVPFEFMAADHQFDEMNHRRLTLGNTDEWILNTQQDTAYYGHPFHIHINSFQTARLSPDHKTYEIIWRDTIFVPQGIPIYVFTRYTDFIGSYVYHCHILDHEDQGMMEIVEVQP